jgi:hypothetical protein
MTLISYGDWYESGRTRTQLEQALAGGRIRRVRRGVLTGVDETRKVSVAYRLQIRAASIYLGEHTYFSHFSAAALHGLPLLARRMKEVTVVRTAGGHGSIHPTLHARAASLEPCDVCEVDGLPVTSLSKTLADLARILPFEEAVMLLDAGLRVGADRPDLLDRTCAGRGCRMAERAITFADENAESPGESLSRVRMHEAGLVIPELQKVITDPFGQFLGRGDFYWEHTGTVGEFDGQVKYDELAATEADLSRIVMAEKGREQGISDVVEKAVRWTWPELWNHSMVRRLAPVVGYSSSNASVSVKRHRAGWSV